MSINEIPNSWRYTPLSNIVEVVRGVTYKKSDSSTFPKKGLLPVIRANNIQNGKLILEPLVYVPSSKISEKQKIRAGDIIVAMSSGSKKLVGKSSRSNHDWDGGFGAFCGILRPDDVISKRFVNWFTNTLEYKKRVSELSAGVNINNLKPSHFDEINIPIASLAEQKQIATKLDELLAQVDTLQARLDSIPAILKRFRQSVLAAAVSGKLTENWREKHGELLDKWEKVKVSDFVHKIESGKSLKCIEIPPTSSELGIVKISAVTWGFYNEEMSKTLPDKSSFIESRRIKVGDFLISRANTIELVGSPVIVNNVTKNLMLSDKVLRFVMDDENKNWLSIFLRSHVGRYQIESRSTGNQMSMRNIGQKSLLDIDIPKTTKNEQIEIVKRVNQLCSFADKVEERVQNAQAVVKNLTQSILAKAFRGELTADWREQNQDLISGKNSAEALLEKIKKEREKLKM